LNRAALFVAYFYDAIDKYHRVPLIMAIEREHVVQDELDGLLDTEVRCDAPASEEPDLRQDTLSQEMMEGRIKPKDVGADITREQ